jgi:hypothetical protein
MVVAERSGRKGSSDKRANWSNWLNVVSKRLSSQKCWSVDLIIETGIGNPLLTAERTVKLRLGSVVIRHFGSNSEMVSSSLMLGERSLAAEALLAFWHSAFVWTLASVNASVTSERGRVGEGFGAALEFTLVWFLASVGSVVNGQSTALNEALSTSFPIASIWSLICVDTVMSCQIRFAIEALIAVFPGAGERSRGQALVALLGVLIDGRDILHCEFWGYNRMIIDWVGARLNEPGNENSKTGFRKRVFNIG